MALIYFATNYKFLGMNALAAALGPVLMQSIYEYTKDNVGPGTMFVFASSLYCTGTVIVSFLQVNKLSNASFDENERDDSQLEDALVQPQEPQLNSDLEEPLIQSQSSSNG
jgi:hypothetical protein